MKELQVTHNAKPLELHRAPEPCTRELDGRLGAFSTDSHLLCHLCAFLAYTTFPGRCAWAGLSLKELPEFQTLISSYMES